jgi:hypothetical protein
MMQEVFVGVDVAKYWLDVHHPSRSASRIDNAPAAACVDAPCLASMIFNLSAGSSIGRVSGL